MNWLGFTVLNPDTGCLEWTRYRQPGGYGLWGRHQLAHRVVYEIEVGPIPDGDEIDHRCFNPPCVNPEHLEAVSPQENRRRKYASITACRNGHPYDDGNTYIRPSGQRDCRACIRKRVKAYKQRQRSAS